MACRAALLSAAVKAACQAKAPRRTVAAVAAAVTTVLLQPVTVTATPARVPDVHAGPPESAEALGVDELEQRLRQARAAKRQSKRQRRRAKAKAAADCPEPQVDRIASADGADATQPCDEPAISSPTAATGKRVKLGEKDAEKDAEMSSTTSLPDTGSGRQRPKPEVCPYLLARLSEAGSADSLANSPPSYNTWQEAASAAAKSSSRSQGGKVQRSSQPPASEPADGGTRRRGPY